MLRLVHVFVYIRGENERKRDRDKVREKKREREREREQFTELRNSQRKSTFSNIGEFIHANKVDDLISFSPDRLLA